MILSNPREISSTFFPKKGSFEEKMHFLLHFAILAPSNMNSQPWKFEVKDNVVAFYPDKAGWLKVSDPDQRELFMSLGCALENFLIAAAHFGFQTKTHYFSDCVKVHMEETNLGGKSSLFPFITKRFTYRGGFQKKKVPLDLFQKMEDESLSLYFTSDKKQIKKIRRLCIEADIFRFIHPEYKAELLENISMQRFEQNIMDFTEEMARALYKKESSKTILRPAPCLAILKAQKDHPIIWMKGGQLLERLYLKACSKHICIVPFSNILEVPLIRKKFYEQFKFKHEHVLQTFRIGYPEKNTPIDYSTRISLDQKLI